MTRCKNPVGNNPDNELAVLEPPTQSRLSPAPLRLLLAEDDQAHAAIVQRAFEREGLPFLLTIAGTLAEASRCLENESFDLVIADWRLPDGEGVTLLDARPLFPLVIMTSYGNERLAVDATRAGALDYVVKSASALMEMPRIAERAMRLWATLAAVEKGKEELRVVGEALRARAREEEWFRLVVEGAPTAMIMAEAGGRIRLVNSQAEQLFGYPRQELLGRPVEMLFPDRPRDNQAAHSPDFFTSPGDRPKGSGLDVFGLRKDGAEVPIEIGLSSIEADEGRFVLASIVDITERKRAQEDLALAEKRFRRLLDASPVGVVESTWEGEVLRANDAFYRMIGWDRVSFASAGLDLRKITPEEWIQATDAHRHAARANRSSTLYEKEYWRRDGARVPVVVGLSVDEAASDDVIAVVVDISEQKRAERLLRENERQLRTLADAMPQIVWTARPDGAVDYFNQRWYEFTGSSPAGEADEVWRPVMHPDDFQSCLDVWHASVTSGQPFETQYRFWDRKSSAYRWHLGRALPLRDDAGQILKWVGTCTDIDDHKRLNEELEQRVASRTSELKRSLTEKTTLLQEVHHRVKNNLQVICSLLSMQVGSTDPKLSGALQEARHRVVAMSLIHEQLYQSDTLSDVDFGAYVKSLARQLFNAYCVDPSRVRLQVSAEAINLPVSDAIPCGLILNELLSNSLKHAFREGRSGSLQVTFRALGGNRIELCVTDDGIGLPADFRIEDTKSMGFRVVRVLVTQLGAELEIRRDAGTSFSLIWSLLPPG